MWADCLMTLCVLEGLALLACAVYIWKKAPVERDD